MGSKIPPSNEASAAPIARSVLSANERFALVVLTLPPYHPGTALHMHSDHTEGCYVIEGTLAVTIGEQTITLAPGTAARIPTGVTHSVWNPTAMPTMLALIYTPGLSAALAETLAVGALGNGPPTCE